MARNSKRGARLVEIGKRGERGSLQRTNATVEITERGELTNLHLYYACDLQKFAKDKILPLGCIVVIEKIGRVLWQQDVIRALRRNSKRTTTN